MRAARFLAAMWLWCCGAPVMAQALVTSAAPEAVSVTLYRDPDRPADRAISRRFPSGFALITETRRVTLPAGPATIRFEGVSGGILPESAILSGVPGVAEKNLDADLLSPRALFDRSTGRRVLIRRTDPASGAVSSGQGVIRSGAEGGLVLETEQGVEAVQCSGLGESLIYDAIPAGLSAKPVLSVTVDSQAGGAAQLTLSYLAGGFDWQANHVVTMRPDGRGADWFAWVTLVSADVTSHVDAGTQLVAGKVQRDPEARQAGRIAQAQPLYARCWNLTAPPPPPPPPPPPAMYAPAPMMARAADAEIVVTGARMVAQEQLGDLKLYRVPMPVTVAARAQKQVGLLDRTRVALEPVYRSDVTGDRASAPVLLLRGDNRERSGLGLPIPSGQVQVFDGGARPILIGEGSLADKAIGEEVEIVLEPTPGVSARAERIGEPGWRETIRVTVTNANPRPIAYEARIAAGDGIDVDGVSTKLAREEGRWLWRTAVPANGTRVLTYRLSDRYRRPDRD
ncbi:DUF4139 domain-containing protein [Sphingomonas japonica]|uniref:DUF4139 domain-containing protein n=1 Tax=Sphingomonas japonica TaxID=511662 RepID=A0ABX0TXN1_9SPHN|nr:hypothetical protein [Sphingomonas japonica]NIJ23056.1 hypothetical protein [Sphingomonas japonica]